MQINPTELDLRAWARRDPDRIALVFGDRRWTYGALEAQVNRLAHVFKSCGLRRGDHVAGLLSNGPFPFVMAWAAYRSGLYFTPIAVTLTAPEVAYIVINSESRLVVVDHRYSAMAATLPGLRAPTQHLPITWLSLGGDIDGFRRVEDRMAQASGQPRDDESPGALMLYTSGTTGQPKGVLRPLLPPDYVGPPPFAADLLKLYDLDADARYLSTAPLYHASPLRFSLAITAGGGTVYIMEKFDANEALRCIEAERITHSQWVPTMFQRLLQLPEARRKAFHAPWHRIALHAAAPCPVPVKHAMIEWWGPIIEEYYSGSEGVGLTALDAQEWLRKPGSVGRAKKGVIHILGEDDRELGAGEPGRIYFSGIAPFAYFNEPEKTAARTSAQGYQTFGDIGYVDDDGYLFLTDRLDDMIISGGVNIYPQEIEAAILEVPEVDDVGVVGTRHADFGECPIAFIVPRAEFAHQPERVRDAVIAHCAARLGRIKRPAEYRIVDALPRAPTGKLLRRILRDGLKN